MKGWSKEFDRPLLLLKTTMFIETFYTKQTTMITPDNELPIDDSQPEDVEQTSQQDIHSNGFDSEVEYEDGEQTADTDALDQAYEASEPSYTLNLDGDDNTSDAE
jgi:hypothetical protein